MEHLYESLASAAVFSKLTPAERASLARQAKVRTYDRGAFICRQGEVWPNVVCLISGRAEWSMISPSGKRQVMFDLGPDDMLWGHSLYDGLPMPASLETVEQCEVCQWLGDVIMPVVSRNPEALLDIIRGQAKLMRRARDIIYGFAFQQVAGRLAQLLLVHYQPAEGQSVSRDLTLDEMAAAVGATRELVCRLLYRFADEGLIRINRTEFTFVDRGKLKELAEQS